ncbi:hypothetical protein [Actinomadura napierensis]|uniref:Uncharacterized protein n=1 Tax=Actinomadura napierensis TaxID=267854 RepID=A0ABP5M605_9ACTN
MLECGAVRAPSAALVGPHFDGDGAPCEHAAPLVQLPCPGSLGGGLADGGGGLVAGSGGGYR